MTLKMSFRVWALTGVALASTAFATTVGSVTEQVLWRKGDNGYGAYRIPAVVTAKNGALLAFCEGRKSGLGDSGNIDVVMRRSDDSGATWGPQLVVWDNVTNTCGNPVPICDQATGRIVLLMTWNLGADSESAIISKSGADTRRVFVTSSDDNGTTWSEPRDITATTKLPEWGWYATGPGGGIQLRSGSHAGRLVAACDHTDAAGSYRAHVITSDDAGATWQLGGVVPDTKLNESQVVELADGRLALNMRNYDRTLKARRVSFSSDAGATWSTPVFDAALIEPVCEASVERVRLPAGETPGVVAFLNPASETARVNLTLRLSLDETATWAQSRLLYAGPSAYSDLTMTAAGEIAALYECGASSAYDEIRFARVALSETASTNASATPSSSSPDAIVTDGLQAWFRADQGVNAGAVADGDAVQSWASDVGETPLSVAASSASRPIWIRNAFQRSDGAWVPAVRFNRDAANTQTVAGTPQRLESAVNTTLALTNDSSWFVVMRMATNHQERGVFGLTSVGVTPSFAQRFGAFFLTTAAATNNRLRVQNLSNPGNPEGDLQTNVTLLVDSRRSGGDAPAVGARVNGSRLATDTTAPAFTNAPAGGAKFRIGDQHLNSPKHYIGDIAEVIVYNRALNDAERVILQNALAARYGLTLASNDLYTGKTAAAGDYDLDVIGIGRFADTGVAAVPGVATNSGGSAGLRLAARSGSLNASGEFLFAGHRSESNGWTDESTDGASCARRWTRVWRVQKISADGIEARLSFDFIAAGAGALLPDASYRLVYRRSAGEAFTALSAPPVSEDGRVSFDMSDAALADGEYTVGLGAGGVTYPQAGIADGLMLWFRADRALAGAGATNGAAVSAWGNYGSIGASADVTAASGSNAPVWVTNGFERSSGVFEPAVRFNWDNASALPTADNLHRLTTGSNTTDFNVQTDSTWFVVFKTLTNNLDRGLFGSSENSSRYGAFFISTPANRLRVQNNLYSYQDYEYTLANNTLMIVDSRRSGPANAAFISYRGNGKAGGDSALVSSNLFSPVKSQFRIGNQQFTTPTNNFIGDIAEVRIYNRAVNDAERIIIQNHLAARYGKTLEVNDLYLGKNMAQGDYDLDVIGIGCMTATGTAALPGTVADSGDAAGLRLVALGGTLANNNEFVFAGHRAPTNAWTAAGTDGTTCSNRWLRDWYLNRASPAAAPQAANDGVDVRLVFSRTVAGGGEATGGDPYRLLFRRNVNEAFTAMPVLAVEDGTKVMFSLTGDTLVNGYYTLGTGAGTAAPDGALPCAGVGRSLRAWFRAGDGACYGNAPATNGAPVTRWANIGLSGAVLDVAATNDAMRPLWVQSALQRADGKWEPALRFNRNMANTANVSGEPNRLTSYPRTTDFDVVTDVSWFLVLKPLVSQYQRGVFGAGDDTYRFGIFYLGTPPNDRMRYHVFGGVQNVDVPVGAALLTEHRRARLAANYGLSARLNGSNVVTTANSAGAPSLAEFRIGSIPLAGVPNNFIGDIAEVRVYNRAVGDAERTIIQNHLAARYGVALTTNDVYAGKGAAAGECDLDVVGIGCATNAVSGLCPGAVTASDASAGLSFEALGGSLAGDGEYLLAGHGVVSNGWIYSGRASTGATYRWRREWYLDKTSADGLDVRLNFDFAAAGIGWRAAAEKAEYRLLWRADAASAYADTGRVPTISGGTLSFELADAGLADGAYTVGAWLPARGTMALVK